MMDPHMTEMKVGLNWPSPGVHDDPPDREHFAMIKAAGFDLLRFNLHHGRSLFNAKQWVRTAREAGLEPLVIIDGEYANTNAAAMGNFAACLVSDTGLRHLEVMNEPRILHRMPAAAYAAVVRALRIWCPQTTLILAAEATKPVAQPLYTSFVNRLRRRTYFDEVTSSLNANDWDVWGIHPYCNPQRPSRSDYAIYWPKARSKPCWVTEVGWSLNMNTEQEQAQYIWDELVLCEALGIPVVCFYAMVADPGNNREFDFGFWREDWTERPAVKAIRDWKASHA